MTPPPPLDNVPKKFDFCLWLALSIWLNRSSQVRSGPWEGGNWYEIQVLIGLLGPPGAKTFKVKLIRYLLNLDMAPMSWPFRWRFEKKWNDQQIIPQSFITYLPGRHFPLNLSVSQDGTQPVCQWYMIGEGKKFKFEKNYKSRLFKIQNSSNLETLQFDSWYAKWNYNVHRA